MGVPAEVRIDVDIDARVVTRIGTISDALARPARAPWARRGHGLRA